MEILCFCILPSVQTLWLWAICWHVYINKKITSFCSKYLDIISFTCIKIKKNNEGASLFDVFWWSVYLCDRHHKWTLIFSKLVYSWQERQFIKGPGAQLNLNKMLTRTWQINVLLHACKCSHSKSYRFKSNN